MMRPGKIPPDLLVKYVFSHLGKMDESVILGPHLGEDASLIEIGDYVIAAATDPITGSISDVGWLAVHVNANDIATFGIPPSWFLSSILLPETIDETSIEQIMNQMDSAAKSLGVSIAGGHTEVTTGIDRPIVAGFMLGITKRGCYVTSSGANPGDEILLTKYAGLEGTSILATEGERYLRQAIDSSILKEAQKLKQQISVVEDGVQAYRTGHVTAMHDPTEGGVANGLHEMCDAGNLGCRINGNSIPVHESTFEICRFLDIDVLQLISSGSMLIACDAGKSKKVVDTLFSFGINTVKIGEFLEDSQTRVINQHEQEKSLPRPNTDALWNALRLVNQENP
ncbi:MAG: hydrogenase [Candidatus Lokiarchaeota archaeon]|nr:hydrogenase [Candidatus Lokiarchaeota archaeon]